MPKKTDPPTHVYKVVSPFGQPWGMTFKTETAAWNRILATKSSYGKRRATRATLIEQGWIVKIVEVTSSLVDHGGL